MPGLLEPQTARRAPVAAADRDFDRAAVAAAVDRTLHAAALAWRLVAYALAGWVGSTTSYGPHLMLGFLCGDFLGAIALSKGTFARAPVAAIAEMVLFVVLLAITALQWNTPTTPELRALLMLAAFAALAARVGWAFGDRNDTIY